MTATIQDPFRKEYRALTDEEKAHVARVKEKASALFEEMVSGVDPRCMATSRTKLEESVMWAVKGITA